MKVKDDIIYIGVNDRNIDLFEGQYRVPQGMSYNSYLILDDSVAVLDTVDKRFTHEWLDNVQNALNGRTPDYLVIHHMEPDHSANIDAFMKIYKKAVIVASQKAFAMMENYFGDSYKDRQYVVGEGSVLNLGRHKLTFLTAPMVHWPEVVVSYDSTEGILFSADAFGRFGTTDSEDKSDDEARRYYIGIVGKYGTQVKNLLAKASGLDIRTICPLHGPVIKENLAHHFNLYGIWANYQTETEGILIAYTSVYGHTKEAVDLLADKLAKNGCPAVSVVDLARTDMSKAVAEAFRYGKVVFATTTYNADVFPFMREFIHGLIERNFSNRTVAFIENGSWAPLAAKVMKEMLSGCKNLTYAENTVKIVSALSKDNRDQIDALAKELCIDYLARQDSTADKNDLKALFNIGYGLYVVTCHDGKKHNGLIVNTVAQLTSSPNRIAVTINKQNYSHHVIKQTGKMNLNCLTVDTPFEIIKRFGFESGRTQDKFEGFSYLTSDNGLAFLTSHINSFISLKVCDYVDLGTHGMFICEITESRVILNQESMTYAYYQKNVKPKPETEGKKGFVCKVCGYVYEGDTLPDDFVCPLCKHGASDFQPINQQ